MAVFYIWMFFLGIIPCKMASFFSGRGIYFFSLGCPPGFPLVQRGGGGGNGGTCNYPKNLPTPVSPPLFCPQNVDFVISMQFLAILPKIKPPTSQPLMGSPVPH